MPIYYAQFQTQVEDKGKNGKAICRYVYRYYHTEQSSYRAALCIVAPIIPFLQDRERMGWKLLTLTGLPPLGNAEVLPVPSCSDEYASRFYDAVHDYEYMVIEGSRLLELPANEQSSGYGAYVRNIDTGATCFASPNGQFFTHGQIVNALAKIHKRAPKHDPTDSCIWHPILFPYEEKKGEPRINLAYYIASDPTLSFPIHFLGHESYDRQLKWIAEQEGLL